MQQKMTEWMRVCGAFLQRNAYGVMLGICLMVIAGTAVYVRWPQEKTVLPPEENIAAGAEEENVERLADVLVTQTIGPAWTAAPLSMAYALGTAGCVWPTEGAVSREHDAQKPVYMPTMERYEVHTGVDIAAEAGVAVVSPMSGTVKAVYAQALWGDTIVLTHPDGLESTLHGVKANGALKAGLAVRAGETIGTVGEVIPYESREGAHVHWTLTRDGAAIDPRQQIR